MSKRTNNIFKDVPIPKVKRNLFDLSHEVKMSGKFGYLYPVLLVDTLPGDTFRNDTNVFMRFAPLLAPILHRCDVSVHYFFVANRLLSDFWEEFITGGQDGQSEVVLPYITPAGVLSDGVGALMAKGSLWDYLGLPVFEAGALTSTEQISVLPFRACAKVWNDYYRDPNLDEEMDLNPELQGSVVGATVASGMLDITKYRRAFEKDYFTSALPWAQRGAQVLIPLSGLAEAGNVSYLSTSNVYKYDDGEPPAGTVSLGDGAFPGAAEFRDSEADPLRVENIDSIEFENASTTINDFRRAIAIQRWLENNARGGARYVEQVESHFNVRVPDYRLQRAEYLGGGKQPVQISEVLATAESTGVDVGDMAGHGISVGRTNRFTYRCQEHGWIVAFLSVTMRTAYSQGIARMFSRKDKFDFAWPELANLGEQEIKSKEIFFSFDEDDAAENDALFGYIPRYSEYKFMNDRIAGDFRDNLGFWHLGRLFTERPSLDVNLTTIYEDGDGKEESFRRIFAVQDGTDYLWFQLYHRLTAKRPLPYFGVPKIL